LPAQTIKQLVGPIGGVEEAFNPRPSEGGADRESLENFAVRGPQTLRHRGRSIRLKDYETLAYEASAAVAFARAIPTHNPSGRSIPGWVTLLIIPQSQEPRPWPSFGLRERVQNYIEARAPADLAAAHQIHVTGPDYLPIEVMATIAPIDPAEAGAVEQRAREALADFLHPLRGGPEGRGWALGRDVFISDVAAVMERIPGIDYVEELGLLLKGALQGERIRVAEDRIVVAGEIQLKLKAGER
jgi:predicted phage baseplate assembly protein